VNVAHIDFQALLVEESDGNRFTRRVTTRSTDALPDGEVLIAVEYSSLNYKDALSATGNRGVTRRYPHTPGIDAAGVVADSAVESFKPGDRVIVTSYDLGMNTSGGFGQYVRVPAAWVVPMPQGMTPRTSMQLGTAGLTAGLSVERLFHNGVQPDQGEVLVTGATGGVGCMAVAILAKLGYRVVAVSGKAEAQSFLIQLGAEAVISREAAIDTSGKPLVKGRWAGVVDTVGGDMLATAIKATQLHGTVTCCGNVASPKLATTVFPFILRGVSLVGIDSQNCDMPLRQSVWQHLADDWQPRDMDQMAQEVPLTELDPYIDTILKGQLKGRVVVKL
jgi:putative YhdH/YhfP family quinone oxidoreductase